MRKWMLLFGVLWQLQVTGQIIDDTSKLVYSTKTTKVIYENDLKNNQPKERHPDSTVYKVEQFTFLDRLGDKYQDLGNNGTAMFPIFYPIPDQMGRKNGWNHLDVYIPQPSAFQYFDTKSPFMHLDLVFGGKGRSWVDFSFTQNVDENLNFGANLSRITSDKQIGRARAQDRNAVTSVYDLFTYYQHPKVPYSAMAYVQNAAFDILETGGIFVENVATATDNQLYQYADSRIQLSGVQYRDRRSRWHVFQQYEWTNVLQFYHVFERNVQNSIYKDSRDASVQGYNPYLDFYGQFLLDRDSTYEQMEWREMTNEVGIKGDLANLFYRLYLKRRDMDQDYLYFDPVRRFSETYLGGYTRFDWKDKFNIEARAELMQTGDYLLSGSLNSELLFGSYTSMSSRPSLLSESYFGNHHEWSNTFQSQFTNEIRGGLQVKLPWLVVRPQARLMTMDRFIYFDQEIQPRQSSVALVSSLGGDFNVKLFTNRELGEAFIFENELYLTNVSGGGANNVRIPAAFFNGRWYFRGAFFKKSLPMEFGLNLHGKSAYYALAYAPEIQQFYLQDDFQINAFVTADAFLNARFGHLVIFVKMVNINQQANSGYFVSPYYPGQPRTFDIGARWYFFD